MREDYLRMLAAVELHHADSVPAIYNKEHGAFHRLAFEAGGSGRGRCRVSLRLVRRG